MRKILALALLLVALIYAADTNVDLQFIPATDTAAITGTVRMTSGYFANTTNAAVTVTLKDRTTNCSGGGCAFWPTVSIAANSVYTIDFKDILVTNGVTWSCSSASAVLGALKGRK